MISNNAERANNYDINPPKHSLHIDIRYNDPTRVTLDDALDVLQAPVASSSSSSSSSSLANGGSAMTTTATKMSTSGISNKTKIRKLMGSKQSSTSSQSESLFASTMNKYRGDISSRDHGHSSRRESDDERHAEDLPGEKGYSTRSWLSSTHALQDSSVSVGHRGALDQSIRDLQTSLGRGGSAQGGRQGQGEGGAFRASGGCRRHVVSASPQRSRQHSLDNSTALAHPDTLYRDKDRDIRDFRENAFRVSAPMSHHKGKGKRTTAPVDDIRVGLSVKERTMKITRAVYYNKPAIRPPFPTAAPVRESLLDRLGADQFAGHFDPTDDSKYIPPISVPLQMYGSAPSVASRKSNMRDENNSTLPGGATGGVGGGGGFQSVTLKQRMKLIEEERNRREVHTGEFQAVNPSSTTASRRPASAATLASLTQGKRLGVHMNVNADSSLLASRGSSNSRPKSAGASSISVSSLRGGVHGVNNNGTGNGNGGGRTLPGLWDTGNKPFSAVLF